MQTQLQDKIQKYPSNLNQAKKDQKLLQEKRDVIAKEVSRGRNFVSKLKTKLIEFCSL